MTDIRKAAEERYPHWLPPEPGTPDPDYSEVDASWQNGMADDQRNAFIAGAEWMREEAAREVEAIHDFYPLDLWPKVDRDHLAALHEFARSLGLLDGSRFHVDGLRHGVALAGSAIRKIGENDD